MKRNGLKLVWMVVFAAIFFVPAFDSGAGIRKVVVCVNGVTKVVPDYSVGRLILEGATLGPCNVTPSN
jgi:hypothetical protein